MAIINPESSKQKAESRNSSGFALLIAVIFMSVILALGLALGSIGYKQQLLASGAIESQYAFYAADSALECALYADQQLNSFDYTSHSTSNPPNSLICDSSTATRLNYSYNSGSNELMYVSERVPLDSNKRCADVTIYKYKNLQPSNITTYIFSQGYDVSCNTVENPGETRFVSRGINIQY